MIRPWPARVKHQMWKALTHRDLCRQPQAGIHVQMARIEAFKRPRPFVIEDPDGQSRPGAELRELRAAPRRFTPLNPLQALVLAQLCVRNRFRLLRTCLQEGPGHRVPGLRFRRQGCALFGRCIRCRQGLALATLLLGLGHGRLAARLDLGIAVGRHTPVVAQ